MQNHQFYSDKHIQKTHFYDHQPPQHQQISHNMRPSILKRSSFTMHDCVQSPTMSKHSLSIYTDPDSSSNLCYHQTNYRIHPQITANSVNDKQLQKLQTFSKRSSKSSQHNLQDKIAFIENKLMNTVEVVNKHQKFLSGELSSPYPILKTFSHTINDQLQQNLLLKQKSWNLQTNLLKGEIESVKKKLQQIPSVVKINSQLAQMSNNINTAISQISNKIVKQLEELNQKKEVEYQSMIKKLEKKGSQYFKQCVKIWEQQNQAKECDQKNIKNFANNDILLKITSHYYVEGRGSNHQIEKCQQIYKIDSEAYLLDHNNHYILTNNNQKIRLSNHHLKQLKLLNIIS